MNTVSVIDVDKIGKKGHPKHYKAFGLEPPMKTIPVNEENGVNLPGLSPEEQVDKERDYRIEAGFAFGGKRYQTRPEDRENITGASVAALAALSAGVQQGDFRWHGGDTDFTWIAEDNSLTPMDAQTMFAFGQAAMAHKQSLIFAARTLKDMPEIPEDFRDDKYWIL